MAKNAADKPKQRKAKTPAPVGRPSAYTVELAAEICEKISCLPFSLKKICEMHPHWPSHSTIVLWSNKHQDFSGQYLDAKRKQIFAKMEYATQVLEEADVTNKTAVALANAKVNLIKWEASHLLPKLFGDRPQEQEPPFTDTEKADLRALMAGLLTKHEREY